MQVKQADNGISVVELEGRIVLGRESQRVEWAVEELLKQNCCKIILDLAQVNYLDSAGLGIFIGCTSRARQAGGELLLVGASERLKELFKITATNSILSSEPTMAAAVERFGAV